MIFRTIYKAYPGVASIDDVGTFDDVSADVGNDINDPELEMVEERISEG